MQPARSLPATARAIMLALALFAVSGALASAAAPITLQLAPAGTSGVTANLTITSEDEIATVVVEATGLAPNSANPIYLHAGTCATPSASFGNLGTLQADAGGKGTLTATRMRAGGTGADVPLTLGLLANGEHILVVAGQAIQACGAIPVAEMMTAAPTQLPQTGDPLLALAAGLGGLGVLGVATGRWLRR